DLHRVADVQHLRLDLVELVAARVLEDQRLAYAECLAVDLAQPLAVLVLDPVVVADRHQLLPHAEDAGAAALSAPFFPPVAKSHPVSCARPRSGFQPSAGQGVFHHPRGVTRRGLSRRTGDRRRLYPWTVAVSSTSLSGVRRTTGDSAGPGGCAWRCPGGLRSHR